MRTPDSELCRKVSDASLCNVMRLALTAVSFNDCHHNQGCDKSRRTLIAVIERSGAAMQCLFFL